MKYIRAVMPLVAVVALLGEWTSKSGHAAALLRAAGKTSNDDPSNNSSSSSSSEKLRSALLTFTVDIYRALLADLPPDANIVYSPFTLTTSLSALLLGASGKTRTQLARALQFAPHFADDGEAQRAIQRAQLEILGERDENNMSRPYALNSATWVIVNASSSDIIRPEYQALVEQTFGSNATAQVIAMDFNNATAVSATVKQVNDMVAGETGGKITTLFEPRSFKNTTEAAAENNKNIFVLNFIYFAAQWLDEFDAAHDDIFYAAKLNSSTTTAAAEMTLEPVTVRMMTKTGSFALLRLSHADIVELPYRQNEVSMVIILPTARDGLAFLEQTLAGNHWTAVEFGLKAAATAKQPLRIALPVFQVRGQYEMSGTLRRMGVLRAFGTSNSAEENIEEAGEAQFGQMVACDSAGEAAEDNSVSTISRSCDNKHVAGFVHEAFFSADEDGSESSSSPPGVQIVLGAIPPAIDDVHDFRAAHPFMFYIRHNPTGIVLLSGSVKRP